MGPFFPCFFCFISTKKNFVKLISRKKGQHNSFGMMIIFFAQKSGVCVPARAPAPWAELLSVKPARDFVLFFVLFCKVPYIQQLEKAVSILNIEKNEKCNKYPVSL